MFSRASPQSWGDRFSKGTSLVSLKLCRVHLCPLGNSFLTVDQDKKV